MRVTLVLYGSLLVLSLVCMVQTSLGAPVNSVAQCPNACNNNGECLNGVCKCTTGFSGADCSVACPNLCSGKGRCVSGKCMCKPGFGGADCATAATCPRSPTDHPDVDCSNHGVCDYPTQTCTCRQGYVGKDCSIDDGSCGSLHCSNRGHCSAGQCQCDLGFSGEHCEVQSTCANKCSGKGFCIGGACHCYPGFKGVDCSTQDAQTCPGKNGGCNGNGVCSNGKCICSIGFSGASCSSAEAASQPFCSGSNTCSNNGVCRNNQCFCKPGFFGNKCEKKGCAAGCSSHGFCSMGVCRCEPGYGGADCSTKVACPNNCSNHGVCDKGLCSCEPYYTGNDCATLTLSQLTCPKSNGRECGGNGICFLGQCFCEPSFTSYDCSEPVANCPNNCGGASRGTCRFGQCFCEPGFEGAACATVKTCPSDCSKRGLCLKGECKCAIGFTGLSCNETQTAVVRQANLEHDLLNSVVSQVSALSSVAVPRQKCGTLNKPCSAHGMCVSGSCVCEPGYGDQDCSLVVNSAQSVDCGVKGCSGNGECLFGSCVCLPGFAGLNCEKASFLPCPNDCSQHGLCYLGSCDCHPGFEGEDCSQVKNCDANGGCINGACVQGVCECVYGWTGFNCTTLIPTAQLPAKDYLSSTGLNTCGTSGCGVHGVCMANSCVCVEGFMGQLCDVPLAGYVTRPSTEVTPANPLVADIFGTMSCSVNCGIHGVCVGGTCNCVDGWAGVDCKVSVPLINSHVSYGSGTADFLSILTLQKRARIAPTTVTVTSSGKKAKGVSLMESDSSSDESESVPSPHRTTAILSSNQAQIKYSPDAQQTVGADPTVLASAPNQVAMSSSMVTSDSTTHTMSMNPWLMTFLCFLTGVLVTITLKCLLDKRDQEKRKMKKMEELLQPAA